MIKPAPLRPGDRVVLLAPSSPVPADVLEKSVKSIEFLGLVPEVYESCRLHYGYLAGDDSARASDINRAFADSNIKGIFCLRGGYGAMRLLPLLDLDMIKKNPKVFVGYSDITALHTVFNGICGFMTFHGPMPSTDYTVHSSYTLDSLRENIFGCKPHRVYNPEGKSISVLTEGKAMGVITGGNLALLAGTLGSPYEIDTKGKIIFIEDVSEEPYQIDRNLTELALAGKFSDAAGIIFGIFADCESKDASQESLTIDKIIDETVLPFGKPAIAGFHAGHIYPQPTIPMGSLAVLDTSKDYIEFK